MIAFLKHLILSLAMLLHPHALAGVTPTVITISPLAGTATYNESSTTAAVCDFAPWKAIPNLGAYTISSNCLSIVGTVAKSAIQADGSYYIELTLAPQTIPFDLSNNPNQNLVVIAICQIAAQNPDCGKYAGNTYALPTAGTKIRVNGFIDYSTADQWYEMRAINQLWLSQ